MTDIRIKKLSRGQQVTSPKEGHIVLNLVQNGKNKRVRKGMK